VSIAYYIETAYKLIPPPLLLLLFVIMSSSFLVIYAAMAVSYTRQEILQVRPKVPQNDVPNDDGILNNRLPENEFRALKQLGLLNRRPTRRGCKSGKIVKERQMKQQLQSLFDVHDEITMTESKAEINPNSSIATSAITTSPSSER